MKRASGVSIPTRFDDLCDPACTALLIYDMQVGIRQQLKSADTIVAACVRALTAARSAGMRVVFTRHLSCPRAWMGATQYRTAMNWQRVEDPAAVRPWFLRGSPASAIIPELQPSDDELVLDKLAMSAFEGTPLAFALVVSDNQIGVDRDGTDDPDYQAWSVLISPFYEIPRQKVFFVRLMTRRSGEPRKARNAGYEAMRRPGGIRVTEERELLVLLSTHQRRM